MVTSITELKTIVESRGHKLVGLTYGKTNPNIVPQASYIQLKCTHCGNSWQTRLQVYLSRTSASGGCRQCYTQNQKDLEKYPNSPIVPRADDENRPTRRRGISRLRNAHSKGKYASIQSREDLINFLQKNPNEHNNYVLPLVIRDTQFPKKKNEFFPGQYSLHHVIPLHDQGSPDSWNIIYVTKEEHYVIHKLRYDVYKQLGDASAVRATRSDFEKALNPDISPEEIFEKKEAVKKENRRRAYLKRRNPETERAIKEGMLWTHKKTGTKVVIQPNSIETIQDIKDLLIKNLPADDSDRQRMLSNTSSSNNYIREHVQTVFKTADLTVSKPRLTVYGFVVQALRSIQD